MKRTEDETSIQINFPLKDETTKKERKKDRKKERNARLAQLVSQQLANLVI